MYNLQWLKIEIRGVQASNFDKLPRWLYGINGNAGLYARGRVLTPADVHDAYTYAGVFYGCTNYRILNLGSLLKAPPVRRGADLSEFVYDFIAESGEVLVVGNPVNGVVHFMVLKSLNEKNFLTIG